MPPELWEGDEAKRNCAKSIRKTRKHSSDLADQRL